MATALCGAALAGEARGGEALADPLLEALIAEALARSPELAARHEQVAAARARPEQQGALDDPMLSVLYTNDGWSPSLGEEDMTTLAFMGSVPLGLFGKREGRAAIAARDAEIAQQTVERTRLGLVAGVTRAYYGLALSRARLALVSEQEQLWRQIEGVARARYAVGQGAQPDVLRVQIEVTRVGQQRTEQEAEARIRSAELNRLTGRAPGTAIETTARLELQPADLDLERTLERLSTGSPELRAAAIAQERGRLEVDLAGRAYKPDLAIQAGYMNRGGLDPMWQAGVSVSLPLRRKRLAGARAEAEAQSRASAGLLEAARQQLRYRTEERLARIEAAETIARLYESGVIPQGRLAVDAALANYQSGKVPFIAVLESLGSLYADRAAHLGLLASHAWLRAGLEEASLGETLELPPAAGGPASAGMGSAGGTR